MMNVAHDASHLKGERLLYIKKCLTPGQRLNLFIYLFFQMVRTPLTSQQPENENIKLLMRGVGALNSSMKAFAMTHSKAQYDFFI